jgi:ubiquinone/menaquinone biosynthesis C-methylase UbiE
MALYADKIVPWLQDKLESREMGKQRGLALEGVSGDVLEIGLGTGANLPYYTEHVRSLTAVEPSAGMWARAERRAKEAGWTLRLTQHSGEQLPFKDAQFDAVVITLVLCTVEDVSAVLREVIRVLRPGGKLHFLEHVASPNPRVRKWQDRLNSIWKVVGCGCNLNRDTERAVQSAGFAVDKLDRATLCGGLGGLQPLIRGVANKPI